MSQPAPPRRGLGRGLASLIPDGALSSGDGPTDQRQRIRWVPVDEVRTNPHQPREVFDPAALTELSDSIRRHGVLSPLVARREDGRYVLIAGERRLRAAAQAGLTEVPVLVRDLEDPADALEIALVENLQRSDLDPIECAKGYQRLMDEFGMTQEQVATRVGKDRATVANAVRLLRLPDFVLSVLREGRISAGHARALLPLEHPDLLRQALGKVLAHQLSVRATEQLVGQALKVDPVVQTVERETRERTYAYATRLLSDALHTSVDIKPRKDGSGRIVIDYADAEDLERLIQSLRQSDPATKRRGS
jgi:ParB family chromosome partitioning protein